MHTSLMHHNYITTDSLTCVIQDVRKITTGRDIMVESKM